MYLRLLIYVTSDCTLKCKWCNQNYTMTENKGYQMSMDEVWDIVESCKKRKLRFNYIELTGGEPSLWKSIKKGAEAFSEICDVVTLVTNGNNPELVLSLNLKEWGVSSSQASKEQLKVYHDRKRGDVFYNAHSHKKTPEVPLENALPADCSVRFTARNMIPQNSYTYIRGKVYYCCTAFPLSEKAGLTPDIVCDFEDDFITKFADKTFDKPICSYCLCNKKVWDQT